MSSKNVKLVLIKIVKIVNPKIFVKNVKKDWLYKIIFVKMNVNLGIMQTEIIHAKFVHFQDA